MPESNLSATWPEIRQRIAMSRGWNPDPTTWDSQQNIILDLITRDGARLFYKPIAVGSPPHEWSFLKPIYEMTLPEDEEDVPLPADFGFLIGAIYFIDPTMTQISPLELKNDGQVLKRRQSSPITSARPEIAAVVPASGPTALHGQRAVLMLYPPSDQDYTVQFRYSIIPGALDPSHPHPYGGAAHANTLIQACLAASEYHDKTPGVAVMHFKEVLAASIEYDRRVGAQSIDNDDGRYNNRRFMRDGPYAGLTTYNGLYSE